ncbi:MAG: tRNA (guanosine(46)-N7)-methyltransferase TrmB, partial [Lachnospiraceae bacterium]|nr:tRNA (guanosine(46)-N7)-methyltransferase TrmB [Lachnospiraceae bacterium]
FVPPDNLHFLSVDARELPEIFAPGEVDGIYLNFSDPWPKARHAKRRLTSRQFLSTYEKYLKDGGLLEFKTDNRSLFDFSVEEFREAENWELLHLTYDLHNDPVMGEGNVMTEYEKKFSALGNKINKLVAAYHGTQGF